MYNWKHHFKKEQTQFFTNILTNLIIQPDCIEHTEHRFDPNKNMLHLVYKANNGLFGWSEDDSQLDCYIGLDGRLYVLYKFLEWAGDDYRICELLKTYENDCVNNLNTVLEHKNEMKKYMIDIGSLDVWKGYI
jgi:hypothetical protein